jgi:hypothetical protein
MGMLRGSPCRPPAASLVVPASQGFSPSSPTERGRHRDVLAAMAAYESARVAAIKAIRRAKCQAPPSSQESRAWAGLLDRVVAAGKWGI